MTKAGRKEFAINPISNLKSNDLFQEVADRDLMGDLKGKTDAKTLNETLRAHMSGLIRPPALSYGDVAESMEDLNLQKYEVLINYNKTFFFFNLLNMKQVK